MTVKNLQASIRPIVTLVLALAFVAGFFLKLVPPDAFNTTVAMVMAFWFGTRQAGNSG